jgi:hypothetical protein
MKALYNGEWNIKTDCPEGRGRIIFGDGSLLVGHFKDHFCHG